ncbi:MAG: ankyrin repeat domain-containing protein [Thermodesulfobacteriota bacterium]
MLLIIAFFFGRIRYSASRIADDPLARKFGFLEHLGRGDGAVPLVDESGKTLLMQAVAQGFEEGVEALLEQADLDLVNHATTDGTTALHCAMASANPAIVARLLAAGANPNLADRQGRTPLWMAAHKADGRIVSLLLEHKAHPDCLFGRNRMTPLMAAAKEGRYQVVDALLAKGANPLLAAADGRTAARFARENLAANLDGAAGQEKHLVRMVWRLETLEHQRRKAVPSTKMAGRNPAPPAARGGSTPQRSAPCR